MESFIFLTRKWRYLRGSIDYGVQMLVQDNCTQSQPSTSTQLNTFNKASYLLVVTFNLFQRCRVRSGWELSQRKCVTLQRYSWFSFPLHRLSTAQGLEGRKAAPCRRRFSGISHMNISSGLSTAVTCRVWGNLTTISFEMKTKIT